MDIERTFTDNGLGLAGLPGLGGLGLAGCPGVARRLAGLAICGPSVLGICLYLRGRAAEGHWGSSRRLFVGHVCLAYVLVGPPS